MICDISTNSNKTFPLGNIKAKFMFIFNKPTQTEQRHKELLYGTRRRVIDELFRICNFTINDFYITSMLKCSSENGMTSKQIKNCLPILLNEIEIVNPIVIITVGATVTNVFTQSIMSIHYNRHKFYKFQNRIILPILDFNYVIKQNKYNELIDDFIRIIKLYRRIVDPLHLKQ